MGRPTGKNKRLEEIKHGTLYMAERLGTERVLRKVFDKFEKAVPDVSKLSEQDIRTILFKVAVSEKAHVQFQAAIGYFDQLPKKRANEQETRQGILNYAASLGVPQQSVQAIFDKYDELLRKATSEEERQQISYMGGIEVHKLLHNRRALVMDGKLIIPEEEGLEPEEGNSKFRNLD